MPLSSMMQSLQNKLSYKRDPHYSADWFSYHIDNWKSWLSRFQGKPALRFLEIGSFEGRSARWLLENILTHPTSKMYCVDLFGAIDERWAAVKERFFHNIKPFQHKVSVFSRSSQDALRSDPSLYSPAFFDCIYIDGSHDSCDVLEDTVLSFRLLKSGGMLIFDDYELDLYPDNAKRNPKFAIDAWLGCFEGQYELVHKAWQVCVVKK